jgi:hypothetical protein
MGNINLETKDYMLMSLDSAFNDDVVQSAWITLITSATSFGLP